MFFQQSFEFSDLFRVGALAFIEIFLSIDNAIVLGVLVHSLPEKLRMRALYIGVFSAFIVRAIALLAASFILQSTWLEAIGGIYLIYLGVRYSVRKHSATSHAPSPASFWKTVLLIEFFDIAFALDSIIAGVAFIAGPNPTQQWIPPKLWIVYVGGMLGVLAIRYAADLFSHLITRFPRLEQSANLLIIWIGVKLLVFLAIPPFPSAEILFWSVFLLLLASGFRRKKIF